MISHCRDPENDKEHLASFLVKQEKAKTLHCDFVKQCDKQLLSDQTRGYVQTDVYCLLTKKNNKTKNKIEYALLGQDDNSPILY